MRVLLRRAYAAIWIAAISTTASAPVTGAVTAKPLSTAPETDAGAASPPKFVSPVRLTPDGLWAVYLVSTRPTRNPASLEAHFGGKIELVMHSTGSDTERRLILTEDSPDASPAAISPSGRWLAVKIAPAAGKDAAATLLAVIDIANGRRSDIAAVRDFRFAGKADDEWLVLQTYPAPADSPVFEIRVRRIDSEQATVLKARENPLFDDAGTRFAWVSPQGLQSYDITDRRVQRLEPAQVGHYRQLTWSKRGTALAALRGDGSEMTLVTFTGLGRGQLRRAEFSPRRCADFPAGFELSVYPLPTQRRDERNSALLWRDDEKGIFFGIQPGKTAATEPAPTTVRNLSLWHWRDAYAPTEQESRQRMQGRLGYLSYLPLADGRCRGLATETLRVVEPHGSGARVLAFDDRAYQRVNRDVSSDGFVHRDYYLLDLRTGHSTLLAKGLWVTTRTGKTNIPRLSPDGAVALYQENGDYIAYDIVSGRRSNLTAGLPAQFFFEEDQRNRRHARDDDGWLRSEPFQGWTSDSRYAFVADYRDVWALPLKGGKAMNLTGNGRRDDIAYRRTAFRAADSVFAYDFSEDLADLRQPLYFAAHDRETGSSGLARHLPGQDGATMLSSEYAELSYQKAERADVYLVTRRTSADALRHAMVDAQWRAARVVLDEAELGRSPGSPKNVYLTHTAPNGKKYHGVLVPPFGYVPGNTYPTIVSIYEELDLSPHSSTVGEFNETYLRHGYAVLMPAIQPRYNEAGVAAVEFVTGAVEAAVATGIADRDRLGLTGYSMGAYNTLIVVSHTDLFKAAIPRAGISNLWSAYGGVHYDSLSFRGAESSQNYLAGPWWDNWQAFLDNSPLFRMRSINTPLLLVHGDQDHATPFANIVELFVSLHRLGTKPVVLLQYAGEGHISYNDDSSVRMLQFFDHFLKGAPAPAWWSEGISHPQGQVATP